MFFQRVFCVLVIKKLLNNVVILDFFIEVVNSCTTCYHLNIDIIFLASLF